MVTWSKGKESSNWRRPHAMAETDGGVLSRGRSKEAQMAKRTDRDIEKGYSTKQMVAKLRGLADCLDKIKINVLS